MLRSVALHQCVKRNVVLDGAFFGAVRFAEINGATLKPSRYRKSVQLHRRSLQLFICAVGASLALLSSKMMQNYHTALVQTYGRSPKARRLEMQNHG